MRIHAPFQSKIKTFCIKYILSWTQLNILKSELFIQLQCPFKLASYGLKSALLFFIIIICYCCVEICICFKQRLDFKLYFLLLLNVYMIRGENLKTIWRPCAGCLPAYIHNNIILINGLPSPVSPACQV